MNITTTIDGPVELHKVTGCASCLWSSGHGHLRHCAITLDRTAFLDKPPVSCPLRRAARIVVLDETVKS